MLTIHLLFVAVLTDGHCHVNYSMLVISYWSQSQLCPLHSILLFRLFRIKSVGLSERAILTAEFRG